MNRFLILLLAVFASNVLKAQQLQDKELIDSLLQESRTADSDSAKFNLLYKVSEVYISLDAEKGIEYGKECIALAEEAKSENWIAKANMVVGNNFSATGEQAEALAHYLSALKIREQAKDSMQIGATLLAIARMYTFKNGIELGLDYSQKALDIYVALGASFMQAQCLNLLGINHYYDGDIKKSIGYNLEALKLAKEINANEQIYHSLNNLGFLYTNNHDYANAIEYSNEAMEIAKASGDALYLSNSIANIAYLKHKLGDDRKAISLFKKSISLLQEVKVESEVLYDIRDMSDTLAKIYIGLGDYKNALHYREQYVLYRDSVTKKENIEEFARLEVKAEYEKIQLADSIQNAEAQKLAEVKLSRQRTFTYGGVSAAILLLVFSLFIYRNNKKLGIEKEKSENLLHNILPEEVASELKDRGATTAQQYDHVTVLFTDFVNFTKAGERMGSQALVEELHNCFEAFDGIMTKYGIEKIKTIGDAYLAVCGLPTADERHAEKVVGAAQEIRTFMVDRHTQLGDKTFEVRVGIHSGEVVAGIVGVKKFAYDIWGDTVNTAARMEQNSEAGKINISQTTYDIVQNQFTCTYRGELEAKNKGKLKMYFVEV